MIASVGRQRGFSLIELLIVVTIIGIIAAIAIPSLLRARMAANETNAIGDSRSVGSANSTYAKINRGCYATTLVLLNQPIGLGTVPFVDSQIGRATPYGKNGTERNYLANPPGAGSCCSVAGVPCGDPGAVSWNYVANPLAWDGTATRAFSVDQSGLVCELSNGVSWAPDGAGTTPPCGTGGSTPLAQ